LEETTRKMHNSTRDFAAESSGVSKKKYTSYVSSSLKQKKKTTTKGVKGSTSKSTR
jgi:hypothetical protein